MRAGVTILVLISNNVNFSVNNTTRDNEDHSIIIPGSIHQRDIIILNVYIPNNSFDIHRVKIDRNAKKKNSQLKWKILIHLAQQQNRENQ